MQLNVNDAQAIEVSELTFGGEFNETLVHQAVVAYMAGGRQGTKQQKTRSDVAGGGKRPWRQKGTGRARAGTTRGPIWRGGGVTFAARPQDHSQKLNKKMYRAALRSILAELVRSDRLVVVQDFAVEAPKTKDLLNKLNGMGLSDVLIVSDAVDQNLYLAARNLPHVDVRDVQGSDPVSLIAYEKVLSTVSAVKKFVELLGRTRNAYLKSSLARTFPRRLPFWLRKKASSYSRLLPMQPSWKSRKLSKACST